MPRSAKKENFISQAPLFLSFFHPSFHRFPSLERILIVVRFFFFVFFSRRDIRSPSTSVIRQQPPAVALRFYWQRLRDSPRLHTQTHTHTHTHIYIYISIYAKVRVTRKFGCIAFPSKQRHRWFLDDQSKDEDQPRRLDVCLNFIEESDALGSTNSCVSRRPTLSERNIRRVSAGSADAIQPADWSSNASVIFKGVNIFENV